MCAKVGHLAISLSPQQPLPSSPLFGRSVPPGANHAVEEKDVLDGRSTWTAVSLRSTTVHRASGLPRHCSPETRNPARKTDRFHRDSCYGRSSSRTARTKGSFTTGQACKGISCADQTCFACEYLRRHFPGSRVRCLSSVQCVRTSQNRGAPLGASVPCRRLDEFRWRSDPVPWSGSLSNADTPCSGHTDSIYDSPLEIASGSGGRVVAKQCLGLMSSSVSLVGAPLLRARVNMVTVERWAMNPLGVVQNIRNLTDLALVSSQIP